LPRVEKLLPLLEVGASIGVGIGVAALVLFAFGYNPGECLAAIFDPHYLVSNAGFILSNAAPLICTAIAFAIPALAGLFNIGSEGQMYLGAITSLVVSYLTGNPFLGIASGMIAGAGLASLIAFLRLWLNINEVVTSIMLNWTLYFVVLYIVTQVIPSPQAGYRSVSIPPSARIGSIYGVPGVLLIAVGAAIVANYIVFRTRLGYTIRVSGFSPKTATYAGMNPRTASLYSMLLAGAFAGLGGALIVQGIVYYITDTMSSLYGVGFTGIGVALLARNMPIAIPLSAFFISWVSLGSTRLELLFGAPSELSQVVTGAILIALAAPYAFRLIVHYIRSWRLVKAHG